MRWVYFKSVRNISNNYFAKNGFKTKKSVRQYMNENNFTITDIELDNIYAEIKKSKQEKSKKKEREQIMLSQNKKRVRSSTERKSKDRSVQESSN